MKNTILLFALFFSVLLNAQVTNEGTPISWKLLNDFKSVNQYSLQEFDFKTIQKEDIINDALRDRPWRFGYKHDVSYGFDDGKWVVLDNGDRVWRIKFYSKGALSMNVIFDQFYMPEGGTVYLYNDDRSDLLGAYTNIQNQVSGVLGTWLVKGETLWVEYYEPKKAKGKGRLNIGSITHGYRNAKTFNQEKALNGSGDCNHDVDCPIGADWEQHKDSNKKAVGILLSGGSGFCTGALVNNTANDATPYFLTANHCYSDPASWAFRFGWISPDPICAETTNSTDETTNMTISGGTLRAKNEASDFCLVEINQAIPTTWDRTWSGWDKTEDFPTFEVGIHHPSGDIMKICRDDSGAIKNANGDPSAETWEITTAGGGWELGVTEPGSSGSPLYDQNGRLIGQLYGGGADCSGTNDNGQLDYYGRFGVSWETGTSSDTRLKEWLDPSGLNPDVLDSYPPLVTYTIDASISVTIPEVACGVYEVNPYITLRNVGATTLTSADIEWNLDGGANTPISWSGSLVQNASEDIALGVMTLATGPHTINATVSNPNGTVDENTTNNTANATIIFNDFTTTQVHLDLLTDDWCQETTWEFRDISGTVLYNGGPYVGGVDTNTHFLEDFDVSAGQCYVFEIFDSYGDGICCTYGDGSYELTTDDGDVIASGGAFSSSETTEISIATTLGFDELLANHINIFPNPTQGIIQIQLRNLMGVFDFSLTNTIGQKVLSGSLSEANTSLSISDLNNGIYFMKITNKTNQKYMVEKIIIQK